MKLIAVNQKPSFVITCIKCGKESMSDTEQYYADVEGVAWKDYYCLQCASTLEILSNRKA